jgi:ABC-2 type transport system permease protein
VIAMLSSVFTHTVGDRLRATVLFALGVVAVAAMYVSVYPAMAEEMAVYAEAIPEGLAAFMGSEFAEPGNYLHGTIFNLLGPLVLVAAAVTFGAAAIAGEEEARTLPALFTVPVSRLRVAAQKLGALVLAITALAAVLFAIVTVLVAAFDIDVAVGRILAASVHVHALGLFALGLSFGVGAAFGRRAAALAVSAGIVVAGYVLQGVANLVEGFDALRWVSPWYWSAGTEPVVHGVAWGWLALLYAAAAVFAAAGMWRFDRRDLTS